MASTPPQPPPQPSQQIVLVGATRHPLRNLYHQFLVRRWWFVFAVIAAVFLTANLGFATAYRLTGGVAHARSFADCFFFSVQTSATIGYGAMYPSSTGAHLLVVAEAVMGLMLTALATGIVFAKFSRPSADVRFADKVAIGMHRGRRTLMMRLGNQRGNSIVEAQINVVMTKTERAADGNVFYPLIDLPLVRSRAPALNRAWLVMHVLDEQSPLYRCTPASIAADEVELSVAVSGIDDITLQTVHARKRYEETDIAWDVRHADLIREEPGRFIVDLSHFDELVPAV